MANEPAPLVEATISDAAVTEENIVGFTNRELKQMVLELRRRLNETIRTPSVPVFASSPITDADIGDSVRDGMIAFSSGDDKLYIRRDGSWVASSAFA